MAQQPPSGPGPVYYRGFTITLSYTPHSVGLLRTSDQLHAETSTWQHTTLKRDRHLCPRRDSNPQSQQASGCRPTPQTSRLLGSAKASFTKLQLSYTGALFCLTTRIHFIFRPFRMTAGIAVIPVCRESGSTCFISVSSVKIRFLLNMFKADTENVFASDRRHVSRPTNTLYIARRVFVARIETVGSNKCHY